MQQNFLDIDHAVLDQVPAMLSLAWKEKAKFMPQISRSCPQHMLTDTQRKVTELSHHLASPANPCMLLPLHQTGSKPLQSAMMNCTEIQQICNMNPLNLFCSCLSNMLQGT